MEIIPAEAIERKIIRKTPEKDFQTKFRAKSLDSLRKEVFE